MWGHLYSEAMSAYTYSLHPAFCSDSKHLCSSRVNPAFRVDATPCDMSRWTFMSMKHPVRQVCFYLSLCVKLSIELSLRGGFSLWLPCRWTCNYGWEIQERQECDPTPIWSRCFLWSPNTMPRCVLALLFTTCPVTSDRPFHWGSILIGRLGPNF